MNKPYAGAVVIAAVCFLLNTGAVMAGQDAGILKARFYYKEDEGRIPDRLVEYCPDPASSMSLAAATVVADVAVSLAGKVVESVIDAAAARTQVQATTLDTTIPIPGYFKQDGSVAVDGGCLVFHNGSDFKDPNDASIVMGLRVMPSPDKTALLFRVVGWKFNRFLKSETGQWFQKGDVRDFVIKIELLTPSSSGLGTRAVYFEQAFNAVKVGALGKAFEVGQYLPWLQAPGKPAGIPPAKPDADPSAVVLPLNVRVTLVETTKPNQLAQWAQEIAKEKKTDLANAVKEAVHKGIDEDYAATDALKQTAIATTAYDNYKKAWDDAIAVQAVKPADLAAGATPAQQQAYQGAMASWTASLRLKVQIVDAQKTLARSAFSAAGINWPGDLPAITVP